MLPVIRKSKLRRIALASQGLTRRQPFGNGIAASLRAIHHLGYLQIDTISVVVRAHNHILRSRVPNADESHVNHLLQNRQIFEYRFPVAAFRPIQDFRFTRLHAAASTSRDHGRVDLKMARLVIDRITAEGPLRSRDFEHAKRKSGGWWDWKPAKRALEQLYYHGDLMISGRDSFEKYYDLTERVLPAGVDVSEPSLEAFADYLIDTTLQANGFASYKSIAAGGRGIPVRRALVAELRARTDAGELVTFANVDGIQMWATADVLVNSPRTPRRVRILSPFDNAITQRERLREVFDFDYVIECFVPEPQRRFGYFCLPVMYADRLIGRMDCKSHRSTGRFEVKALYLEPEFSTRHAIEDLAIPMANELLAYASFDNCHEVTISQSEPATAKTILTKAIAAATA
jgi:uncharacterized protein YcaQ